MRYLLKNFLVCTIMMLCVITTIKSFANEYQCTLDQLPANLVMAIKNSQEELLAWNTRDPNQPCDLRDYTGLSVFRWWSEEVRDPLNDSYWHMYQACEKTNNWVHVKQWDDKQCSS